MIASWLTISKFRNVTDTKMVLKKLVSMDIRISFPTFQFNICIFRALTDLRIYYNYWSKIVESRPRFAKSKNSLCLQGPTWTTLQNKLRFGIFALFFSKSANCEYLMAFIEVSRYLTKTVCIFNSNNHFRGQLKWRLYRRKNSLLSLYNLKVKGSIKD